MGGHEHWAPAQPSHGDHITYAWVDFSARCGARPAQQTVGEGGATGAELKRRPRAPST
jgi:hypothetical protein